MKRKELLEKIRIQKGLHSYYEMVTKPVSMFLKAVFIILPALITFLAISDLSILSYIIKIHDKDDVYIIITIIGFLLFLLSILSEIFEIEVKYKLHRSTINQLIKLRTNYLSELEKNEEDELRITEKYSGLYLEIIQNCPEFTDKQYIKGKKYYIKRLEKKMELDQKLRCLDKVDP